jgi:hypothetical protein
MIPGPRSTTPILSILFLCMVLTLCLDEEKNVLSLNFDFFFFYIFTLHVIVGASEQKNGWLLQNITTHSII